MFHWVNLLLQPAETAARKSEWSAHDWKEFEHSGASVGFEWTRGEETGGQVHEVKIPDESGFFKDSEETPFIGLLAHCCGWLKLTQRWHCLPPTTAVGQKVLFHGNLFLSSNFYQIVPLCTRASVVMVVLFILCNTPRIIPNAMELYYPLREMEKMTVRIIKQVCSLTQCYFVGFLFKDQIKKRVLQKCSQGLRFIARHLSLYLWSSRSNVRGEDEGPLRALCQFKKPFKGPRPRRGSCWKEWENLPKRRINDLL